MVGWITKQMDGWMDRKQNEKKNMDGWMDKKYMKQQDTKIYERMDGWMDK